MHTRHNYRGVSFAVDSFLSLSKKLNISDHTLKDNSEGITLDMLLSPGLWLNSLMMRSDYLSTALFNTRLWDVYYCLDNQSLDGLRVMDMAGAESLVTDSDDIKALESYQATPLSDSNNLTAGLFGLLLKKSVSDVLVFEGDEVSLNPLSLNIFMDVDPVPGRVLPHPDNSTINIHFFSEFLADPSVRMAFENSRRREFQMPSPGQG